MSMVGLRRLSFGARLLITVAITLSLAGVAQYVLSAGQLERRVTEQAMNAYAGDAEVLEGLHESRPYDRMALAETLGRMVQRPEVQEAALVAADGEVLLTGHSWLHHLTRARIGVAAAQAEVAGSGAGGGAEADAVDLTRHFERGQLAGPAARAMVEEALATATMVSAHDDVGWDGLGAYAIPVELGHDPQVLMLVTDRWLLDSQLQALRSILVLGMLAALVAGVPLFYVLGGRGLAETHRRRSRQAMRDPLTELGNHRACEEALGDHIARARQDGGTFSVALLDLDGFKLVNDTAGHRRGDELLQRVALILGNGRMTDEAFRVGGDEFALILRDADLAGALVACERVRDRIVDEVPDIGVSTGIAEFGVHGDETESLWYAADAAMYQAKRLGTNHIVTANELEVQDPETALTKTAALQALIAAGELDIVFQPIVAYGDRHVLGYEALARPPAVSGFDGPADAFATAERVGLVPEFDALCRRSTLAAAQGLPAGSTLFLNIAPAALDHPLLDWAEFAGDVRAAGLDPSRVVIEVSERIRVPLDVLRQEVARARQVGFQIALDDIGAGLAGFSALGAIQPDIAKIDRSVVSRLTDDPHAQAVMHAMATYGAYTGARLILEGVETEDQLDHLREDGTIDVHGLQGYLLGRPSPLVALVDAADPGREITSVRRTDDQRP